MQKDNNYKKINEYYNKFNEDKRLQRKHGQVEFKTSMNYISKYVKAGDCLVDIGCGTGKYTFAIADLGVNVDAIEYTKANFKVLEKKLKNYNINDYVKKGKVNIFNADARNLSKFEKEKYDLAIIFGPLYHLDDVGKIKSINEAKKIIKRNGIMFISYIMNDYAVLFHSFIENCFKDIKDKLDDNFHIKENEKDLYFYSTIDTIEKINRECGLKSICRFSQEGPSDYIRPILNKMDEETFEGYMKWHLANCEKKELLGAGTHIVDVVKIAD